MNINKIAEERYRVILKAASVQDKLGAISDQIRSLMESYNFYDWRVLDELLNLLTKDKSLASLLNSNELAQEILNHTAEIRCFPMFLFVYWLCHTKKLQNIHGLDWKLLYTEICDQLQQIQQFNIFITNVDQASPESKALAKQTLLMLAKAYSTFAIEQRYDISGRQLDSLFIWLASVKGGSREEVINICNLVKIIKEARNIKLKDYEQKEHIILKKIIELMGKEGSSEGSLYLLMDQFTIKEKDIEYFCHINESFIEDLDENYLCNVFLGLTVNGINKEILSLINIISHILESNQEYYILKILYQHFILPVLANQFKACKKVTQQLYYLTKFYVIGFSKHCNISYEGIDCILNDIQIIENKELAEKWLQLAFKATNQAPELLTYLQNKVKMVAKLSLEKMQQIKNKQYKSNVWTVTLRNGRKHKKYPQKYSTQYRGITNRHNQCYIISTVQSLFMTHEFVRLVDEYKPIFKQQKMDLMNQFWHLFGELAGKLPATEISIKYLKKDGPEIFKEALTQEDAQQYIIFLFSCIEQEIKTHQILAKRFKLIFQIGYKNTIRCKSCNHIEIKHETSFMHTIPVTEEFQYSSQEVLDDYICQKCKKQENTITREFVIEPLILLVHINRFAHHNNETKKLLGSKSIKRKIQNYELVGFICHKGKTVSNGHYLYYAKIGKLKWVEMTDRRVSEFDLTTEDEEFEREMKAQTTPYILFYHKKS